jgi:hypothetical protein
MLKNRAPYDAEVDAEVAKEYQRIQDEKRKVRPDHGAEIEAIRTRMWRAVSRALERMWLHYRSAWRT